MRYTTLTLPSEVVCNLLPNGLRPGPQEMTPRGTHPVLMGFHDMFRLHTSVPSLLPSMTYHEHSVGVPYCYLTDGPITPRTPGPYFFMPMVFLDHLLATLGGLMFWGYVKQMATISHANSRYSVAKLDGEPVVSLSYDIAGDAKPLADCPLFELQRQALSQTVISQVPLGVGPFFVLARFPKHWGTATLTPLMTVTEVFTDYVIGLSSGRYPPRGRSEGIDASVAGAYELRTSWTLSAPYPLMP
jgi:hypothetical protein